MDLKLALCSCTSKPGLVPNGPSVACADCPWAEMDLEDMAFVGPENGPKSIGPTWTLSLSMIK